MDTDKANVTRWLDQPQRINMDVLSGVADALAIDDLGNLLRPPQLVKALDEAKFAARQLLETLPASSARPARR